MFLGVDRGRLLLRVGPPQQEHHARLAPIAHSLEGASINDVQVQGVSSGLGTGARFNWKKILMKILMKILKKVKFEKETCTNYFFMNFLL